MKLCLRLSGAAIKVTRSARIKRTSAILVVMETQSNAHACTWVHFVYHLRRLPLGSDRRVPVRCQTSSNHRTSYLITGRTQSARAGSPFPEVNLNLHFVRMHLVTPVHACWSFLALYSRMPWNTVPKNISLEFQGELRTFRFRDRADSRMSEKDRDQKFRLCCNTWLCVCVWGGGVIGLSSLNH